MPIGSERSSAQWAWIPGKGYGASGTTSAEVVEKGDGIVGLSCFYMEGGA